MTSQDVAAQTSSTAQASAAPEIVLSFDRPEAWAMKYFTSATFLSGLNTLDETHPGSIAVGFEGVWLPSLSQIGTVTGGITCPPSVLAFKPGSANNTAGCEAESSDVTTLRYGGVELHGAHRISEKLSPHVAVGVTLIDSVFQTNALTFGRLDRTRLFAHGVTFSASAGIGYAIADRFAIAADAFYSRLTVRRTPTSARSTDPLINARVLVSYRVRR